MNFNALRYVVTVAEERSFTRAAKRLYVSQPSLSQGIQTLEARLGTPLFNRKTTPLTLTHAGRLYVEWAKNVLLSQSQLNRELSVISGGHRSKLVVGTASHGAALLMPEPVRLLLEQYTDCDVMIEEGTSLELYDRLSRGDMDVMVGPPHSDTIRFTNVFVMSERLLLAVPTGYGTIGEEVSDSPYPSVHLSEFKDRPFISTSAEQSMGYSIRALCERDNFLPTFSIECRQIETAHALVSKGLGVTILPELLMQLGTPQPDTDYFSIAKSNPCRDLSMVYRATSYLTNQAKSFIEIFLDLYRERAGAARHVRAK